MLKAAICGLDGQVWGKSENFNVSTLASKFLSLHFGHFGAFQLSDQEAQFAARGFANPSGLQSTGMRFEGEKYFVLNVDNDRVIGKKAAEGFFIYKTSQSKSHHEVSSAVIQFCYFSKL